MRKVKPEVAAGLLRESETSGEPMSSWCTRRGLNWYSLSAFKGWGVRPQRSRSPRSSSRDFRADTLQRLLVAVAAC